MVSVMDGTSRTGQMMTDWAINQSFTHWPQNGKADGNDPAGFNLEEEMAYKHLNFLTLMLVTVIIKVKIIIKKR
jgi:hypothetical protein